MVRQAAQAILHGIPPELRAAWNQGAPTRWIADPICRCTIYRRRRCGAVALPAGTPSLRFAGR